MAIALNGSSQYVQVGAAGANIYSTRPFSLFALIDSASLRSGGAFSTIFSQGLVWYSGAGGGWSLLVEAAASPRLELGMESAAIGQSSCLSTATITRNGGNYLVGCVVRDGGANTVVDFFIYRYATNTLSVNAGVAVSPTQDGNPDAPTGTRIAQIGAGATDTTTGREDYFAGTIGWCGIWAGDLGNAGSATASAVWELIARGPWGLIDANCRGLWVPSGDVLDRSQYGNNGTLGGSPGYTGSLQTELPPLHVIWSRQAAAGGTTHQGAAALTASGTVAATGQRAVPASTALTASATVAASGRRAVPGATALAASGTVAASGRRAIAGASAQTGTATLAAAGRVAVAATAALLGGVSLAATGRVQALASAALTASGTVAADGTVQGQVAGAAALTASATVAAVGRVAAEGATGLTATATIAPTARVAVRGTSALTATATVAAEGTASADILGAATLTASATLAAVGTVAVRGAGLLAGAANLVAAGRVASRGAATLTGAAALAASGGLALTGAAALTASATLSGTAASGIAIPNPSASWGGEREAAWAPGDVGAWGGESRGRWG